MAGNGGVIGPPNSVTQIFKDKVTTFTSSGTFNKATTNPAAPGNATVVVLAGGVDQVVTLAELAVLEV